MDRCITMMRQCVVYIHDSSMTFIFDLKVNFCLTFSYHIWHMGLSPWDDISHTSMIWIQHWPLTSKSKFIEFWTWHHIGVTVFFVFVHGHTIFGTCVNIMEWYTYHIHLRPSHVTFTLDFWVKTDFCLMHECVCLSLQEIIIASCNCSCLPFYFSF